METKIKKKGDTYKLTLKNISDRELQLLWGMLVSDDKTICKLINKGLSAQPGWYYPKAKPEEFNFYRLWNTIDSAITPPTEEVKDEQ